MEVKHKYSDRTLFIIVSICLIQFVAFLGITFVENQKRDVLEIKLKIKRDSIANISTKCQGTSKRQVNSLQYKMINNYSSKPIFTTMDYS